CIANNIYPMQGNSILQDLYLIANSDPQEAAQQKVTELLQLKTAVDQHTKFVGYDKSKNIMYSHAPSPIECFVRLAMQLKEKVVACDADLSTLLDRFKRKGGEAEIKKFITSFADKGDAKNKDNFEKITNFINKQYSLYLTGGAESNAFKSIFDPTFLWQDEGEDKLEYSKRCMRDVPANYAVWARQGDLPDDPVAGDKLHRVVGHDGNYIEGSHAKLLVYDGEGGKRIYKTTTSGGVEQLECYQPVSSSKLSPNGGDAANSPFKITADQVQLSPPREGTAATGGTAAAGGLLQGAVAGAAHADGKTQRGPGPGHH
ncbi:MAG: hypothetical protein ABGY11_08480, partial [Candidatus Thioglobus sp.]